MRRQLWLALVGFVLSCKGQLAAEVVATADGGFQIKIVRTSKAEVDQVDHAIIHGVGSWWDSAHTFSANAHNLSIDLENRRFHEALPGGGFVTHLEIAHYNPGEQIRFIGGLGPLQEMGLHGALTIQWKESEGRTVVTLSYNVSGYSPGGLKTLAPVVDAMLKEQVDRLCAHCDKARKRSKPHQHVRGVQTNASP